MLASLARLFLDAVAPRRCAGCDSVSNEPICAICADVLGLMPVPAPRPMHRGRALAGFEFVEPVRSALHRGKYGGDRHALMALAALTAARLDAARPADLDAIVAVPLGARRQRQRGYNQSDVVARVIADGWNTSLLTDLVRIRNTPPQSARDEASRRGNVAGAFAWRGNALDGARLWLVDDVLTTGATVDSAASTLSNAGGLVCGAVVVAIVP